MKTPKPVKAWAIVSDESGGQFAQVNGALAWTSRGDALSRSFTSEHVVPVTISVGDTAAEVRRLRKLLRGARRELRFSPFPEDIALVDKIDAALARKGRRNG